MKNFYLIITIIFLSQIDIIINQCTNAFTGLTDDDKQTIVRVHNDLRNQVATGKTSLGSKLPFATNMMQMYWYDPIAIKAQAWADSCQDGHSTYDFRQQGNMCVGENIYTWSGTAGYGKIDFESAIKSWFSEITVHTGNPTINTFSGGASGHFTQVIWAESYLIGCGVRSYMKNNWYTNNVICQYGTCGNMLGSLIYKSSGTQVCLCPTGSSCSNTLWQGLCCLDGKCSSTSTSISVIQSTTPSTTSSTTPSTTPSSIPSTTTSSTTQPSSMAASNVSKHCLQIYQYFLLLVVFILFN